MFFVRSYNILVIFSYAVTLLFSFCIHLLHHQSIWFQFFQIISMICLWWFANVSLIFCVLLKMPFLFYSWCSSSSTITWCCIRSVLHGIHRNLFLKYTVLIHWFMWYSYWLVNVHLIVKPCVLLGEGLLCIESECIIAYYEIL